MNETKQGNPKDRAAISKLPFHQWPETATVLGVLALLDGCGKYGRSNWRVDGAMASVYYDACRRHLNAWFEGEEEAADSGVSHLGHAIACIAILIDAQASGLLVDDRMVPGGYGDMVAYMTPRIAQIVARHTDKSPKHYDLSNPEGRTSHGEDNE